MGKGFGFAEPGSERGGDSLALNFSLLAFHKPPAFVQRPALGSCPAAAPVHVPGRAGLWSGLSPASCCLTFETFLSLGDCVTLPRHFNDDIRGTGLSILLQVKQGRWSLGVCVSCLSGRVERGLLGASACAPSLGQCLQTELSRRSAPRLSASALLASSFLELG